MSFSRKYPVSSYHYDPAVQPTKQIAQLANNDEKQAYSRQVPQGRFDTTYRREFLNFENGVDAEGNPAVLDTYGTMQPPPNNNLPTNQDQASLNPFPILPPISAREANANYQGQQKYQSSIDHIVANEPNSFNQSNLNTNINNNNQNAEYLPPVPINLTAQEELALVSDVKKEFKNANADQIRKFYSELAQYDPRLTGFVHYQYVNISAMKANLPVNESLMRFVMSRFVSPQKERGYVNYDELIKFFDRCIQEQPPMQNNMYSTNNNMYGQQPQMMPNNMYQEQMPYQAPPANMGLEQDTSGKYDPDEQAILRLMHENMREWDQINLVNCDHLRRKFYQADRNQSYILSQSEIEDVCYRNRVPIQRSLTFQILEKYCKVTPNRYRWPAFVDFLEKLYNLRLPNKKKTDYTIRTDEKDNYAETFVYRIKQLDTLKSKASEEERIEEINKQINNLQSMKSEVQQNIGSNFDHYAKGESWFTRFMRLANAIYSHRTGTGGEFSLPTDEARSLIKAYNMVYELKIPHEVIEDGLTKCQSGNMLVIDDLLKVLSKVNIATN